MARRVLLGARSSAVTDRPTRAQPCASKEQSGGLSHGCLFLLSGSDSWMCRGAGRLAAADSERQAPSAPSLDLCARRRESVQRCFGRRPLARGGQQQCQAGVCPQFGGLEDEIEIAEERVVKPVQASC